MIVFVCFVSSCSIYLIVGMVSIVPHFQKSFENKNAVGLEAAGQVGFIILVMTVVIIACALIFTKDNIITKAIKAFFGKYCPKIDWE